MTAAPRTTSTQGRRFAALPLAAAASNIPARAFRVLVAICASADAAGCAWPGVTEISRRTGIPRKKIPAEVKRLELARLIRVERQPGRGSVYGINYEPEPSPQVGTATVPPGGDSDEPGVSPETVPTVPSDGTKPSPQVGTKQTIEQTIEQRREHTPSLSLGERVDPKPGLRLVSIEGERLATEPAAEPILTPESEPAETAPRAAKGGKPHPAEIARAFAEFWPVYPRRVARGAAERAYAKALKGGASPATILLGVRRFAEKVARDGTEAQYIPHPATWLNATRWDDEPEPATSPKFKSAFLADLHASATGGRPAGLSGEDSGGHDGVTLDLEAEPEAPIASQGGAAR